MASNTFGRFFTLTTAGESHGPAMVGIVDGCPPGLALSESDLQPDLDRRRPGSSHFTTQRREPDRVKILSGVFNGVTTGMSIALLIENIDQKSKDYGDIAKQFRPGHADFTYQKKYGIRDHRGGGRSSARETAMWVAAGAIAKKYLREQANTSIKACLTQMGDVLCPIEDWDSVDNNPFFCAAPDKVATLAETIQSLRKAGDSTGAEVTVIAEGVPVGLGEPVFGKIDAELAAAFMSINAAKAVAIGDGFAAVAQRGSQHRDEMTPNGFLSNHAGGILGGITTGQPLVARVAFKPTSSILIPGQSIDIDGQACTVVTKGRHDPCVGIRAVPIVEAMMALVLMDQLCRNRGQMTVES